MSEILKGTISTIESSILDANGYPATAKVISATGGSVTKPLIIPWHLRSTMGNLASGVEVIYALFEDKSGYILGRADGEFQGVIPYSFTVDGSQTTTGNVSAADFISDTYGSTNAHTHTDSQGGTTSAPNA